MINPSGYDILVNGTNRYINFNNISGSTGYGIRDNGGVMELKNSGYGWSPITGITVSATAPSDPYVNQLWFDIS